MPRWRARGGAFPRTVAAAFFIWSAYWLAITVLQWHVSTLPGATADTVGLLYFIQLSPMLLLTPLVGRLLEQVGGRPVLLVAAGFMTVVGVLGWVLAEVGLLLFAASAVLSACLGLCMAVGSPAVHAFVPATVDGERLPRAVRGVAIAQNLARLLGPTIAGILLVAAGTPLSLVAVAVVALCGMLLLLPTGGVAPATRRSAAEIGGVLSGFRIAGRSPLARRALLLALANSVFGLSHVAMLPILADDVLGGGETGYAAMMVAGGLGAMVGALFPIARMRTARPFSVLFAAQAAAMALLALAPGVAVAVIASGLVSAVGVMTAISLNIRLQSGVAQHGRGRVMSLFTWAWGGFLPIGGLLLGLVGGAASVPVALLMASGLLLSVAWANLVGGRTA